MHERKAAMAQEAEAFIALPGEFFLFLVSKFYQVYTSLVCFYQFKDVKLLVSSGGYGTMEELLEMITWAQLGIHEKTVFDTISVFALK